MAPRVFLLLLTFLTFSLPLSSALSDPNATTSTAASPIDQACKATRFPEACKSSLTNATLDIPSSDLTPFQTLHISIAISLDRLKTAQIMVADILRAPDGSENRTIAAKNCIPNLQNSEYRLLLSQDSLQDNRIKSARASLSSALIYQNDCWHAFKFSNDTKIVVDFQAFINDTLFVDTSNVLSMAFSYELQK